MVNKVKKAFQLIGVIILGIFLVATVIGFARDSSERVSAAGPIDPPVGYPKLSLSTKEVTPTLAYPNVDAVLTYHIEILNTGAYSASNVTLLDTIPSGTTYNNDAVSSNAQPPPTYANGVLTWHGVVGFDSSEVITYSVTVNDGVEGVISNTATISDPMIPEPITIVAEALITDHPVFEISKTATPEKPGKNKPLTYELTVTNVGQDAVNELINVTDFLPANTTILETSSPCTYSATPDPVVTCDTPVSLETGDATTFSFIVQVGNVSSGTVIANNLYNVVGAGEFGFGEPYTTTVVDPILLLSKSIYPDPPGSNREMTYTLTVLNLGSEATNLVVQDTVPQDLTYVRGGAYSGGVVTWNIPSLATNESAQVSFTVYVGDVAGEIVLNGDYHVCSAEGVCATGVPVPSLLVGPTFEVTAEVDPIAHKPGGGSDTYVTPTLTLRNLGPGNALDATALLNFGRISVSTSDVLKVIPPVGMLSQGEDCGERCYNYLWTGDIAVGEIITITTIKGQSTVGGEEGTHYTATIVVTDDLSGYVTEPISATAIGHVTHHANLIPTKDAPPTIGPGQTMTYMVEVLNSGLSTEEENYLPSLTETVPASVTLLSVSDGGTVLPGEPTVISWTLPAMSPGDYTFRSFNVQVDPDLVSGTLIVNDQYGTSWYESEISGTQSHIFSNAGEPVTTTVREVGLIDSYKVVSPTWALPGEGTVLTYVVHVVNSGPNLLDDVTVTDIFPWENTTYQRNAVATSGNLSDDIVSFVWTGDMAPYSEELITFTTKVDDFFEGVVTNTVTISDDSLKEDKVVTAVAYITDEPVLRISKMATPDPVEVNDTLLYEVEVTNLGNTAYQLSVTDALPVKTEYIAGSASSGGTVVNGVVTWQNTPLVLYNGQTQRLTFQVKVLGGHEVINDSYVVCTIDGVCAYGDPVVTRVLVHEILLPVIYKR